ncbi:sugar phosphate isomerase/epimerase family protein [Tardiphaga robiniae]|uniref:Xylose isomerase n=1 Tax=Tardiphaga robiniae TaxID=943830 RepID=A0A163XM76_9BRAD|nr:sugar phosphate isomerase/epimerase family protein [Tardiphaga robiniae]KZD21099.1 xylose isomerase [Tardiphaga robiniae]
MARDIGVNTYGYIWSIPAVDCVRRLGKLGYRQIEFLLQPPHLSFDDFGSAARRELRAVLQDIGATKTAINLPSLDHNLASPFSRARAASVRMFEDTIDLAADIGAETVVVVPGRMSPLFPPSVENRFAWVGEGVSQLLPRAEDRGVGLAIENVPFAAFPDAAALERFVRGFTSSAIGVCYDAANAHFIDEDPAAGVRQLSDLLRIVHFSDTGQDKWRHDPIGTGTVPFADVVKALDAVGFEGAVTLEILDHDPDAAILRSHRALELLGFAPCKAGASA